MADRDAIKNIIHNDDAFDIFTTGETVWMRLGSRTIRMESVTQVDRYLSKGKEVGTSIRHMGNDGKERWFTSTCPYSDVLEMMADASRVLATNKGDEQ